MQIKKKKRYDNYMVGHRFGKEKSKLKVSASLQSLLFLVPEGTQRRRVGH